MTEDRLLLTRQEAAKQCAISLRTFERCVQPHIPHIRIGALIRFRKEDLCAWFEKHMQGVQRLPQTYRQAGPRRTADPPLPPRAAEILTRIRKKMAK